MTSGRATGFTLIELLVAMVVISILSISAVRVFVDQHQVFFNQNEGVRIEENARAGFEMLVRDARNAGFDPRGVAGSEITKWTVDSFGWTADLNADGDLDDESEDVLYFFDPDQEALVREEPGLSVEVAESVIGLSFTYLEDAGGTVASSAATIELVAIEMSYEMPEGTLPGALETQIALRNAIFE